MPSATTSLPLRPENYYDKVLGGWVGKSAGGILGAPIEGYKTFNSIELTDELFDTNFPNDDLDLQVLWLDMVAQYGPYVREADFARHWRAHVAFPWNEYGVATRNLTLGLDIPDSGRHNNSYWSESMGSPIRSEIWGMLFPGDPERAARYARIDSELDHTGFSVHAEQFFAACAALAFTESDLHRILNQAIGVLPFGSVCAQLFHRVRGWYDDFGFAVAAGKVKSYYGDADFTSAPMNVGFTMLSILHAGNDFDRIIESLHLGHDSDCVVATAAAILGILHGNDDIPELWRQRVGNELLISPEVSGIRCPATLTELAEWTCEIGTKLADGWPTPPEVPFAVHVEVTSSVGNVLTLTLVAEDLSDRDLSADYLLSSAHFPQQAGSLTVAAGQTVREALPPIEVVDAPSAKPSLPYTLDLTVAGRTLTLERGIPQYGSWLLLGPFIRPADELAPMDEEFPDHGMSSLPSVRYMNHDRVNGGEDFVDHATIDALLDGENRQGRSYGVSLVRPRSMTVDLGRYFHGRGERTLYLTTRIESDTHSRHWLCLGSTAHLTAWVNGQRVLDRTPVRRRWPATAAALIDLRAGANTVTIRLDTVVDDYALSVGLKDFAGKHHHQSHWNTTLSYGVPALVADYHGLS